jgi:hypothetical protein
MDINKEVLRQIKESKGAGEYMLQGFTESTHGVFNSTPGFNATGNTNSKSIDADSFLKNLNVKTTYMVKNNPLDQKINFKPIDIKSKPVNIQTREKRSVDGLISNQDISSRSYQINVGGVQNHIDYRIPEDSRKR